MSRGRPAWPSSTSTACWPTSGTGCTTSRGRARLAGILRRGEGDPPLETGLALAHELATEHDLAYLTGRPEGLRRVTRRWLTEHGLPPGPLVMRPAGDYRPARVMKLAALRGLAADREVEIVIDDDHEVVRALEEAGFAVLQASWADPVPRPGPRPAPGPGGGRPDLTKPDRDLAKRPDQPVPSRASTGDDRCRP